MKSAKRAFVAPLRPSKAPGQRRASRKAWAVGGIAVTAVAAVLLITSLRGHADGKPVPIKGTYILPAQVVSEVADVPVSALVASTQTTAGSRIAQPEKLPPNTSATSLDSRPEVFYLGAQFCASCAAERWALVTALSKFGTFTNLGGTVPSASHFYPGGPTFSFSTATYTSSYLSFITDEQGAHFASSPAGQQGSEQILTQQEQSILTTWDVAPYASQYGSIPFIYMAGKFLLTGVQFDDGAVSSLNFPDAVKVMVAGKETVSRRMEAAAAYLIADMCALTSGRPASVCQQMQAALGRTAASTPWSALTQHPRQSTPN
jgi:hypothetical protein